MRHMRAGIPVPSLRPAAWTTIPGGRRRRAGTLDRRAVIRSARQAVRPSGSGRRCRPRRTRQDDRPPRPVTVLVLLRVPEVELATSAHGCRSRPTRLGPFPVLLPGADGWVLRGCGPPRADRDRAVRRDRCAWGGPPRTPPDSGPSSLRKARPSPPDDVPRSRCGRGRASGAGVPASSALLHS